MGGRGDGGGSTRGGSGRGILMRNDTRESSSSRTALTLAFAFECSDGDVPLRITGFAFGFTCILHPASLYNPAFWELGHTGGHCPSRRGDTYSRQGTRRGD